MDKRRLTTTHYFFNALDSLLLEIPFQNLTVSHLCQRAKRSEQTFVRNFKTMKNFISVRFEHFEKAILNDVLIVKKPHFDNYTDNLFHELLYLNDYLYEHKKKMSHFLKNDEKTFRPYFEDMIKHTLQKIHQSFPTVLPNEKETLDELFHELTYVIINGHYLSQNISIVDISTKIKKKIEDAIRANSVLADTFTGSD